MRAALLSLILLAACSGYDDLALLALRVRHDPYCGVDLALHGPRTALFEKRQEFDTGCVGYHGAEPIDEVTNAPLERRTRAVKTLYHALKSDSHERVALGQAPQLFAGDGTQPRVKPLLLRIRGEGFLRRNPPREREMGHGVS